MPFQHLGNILLGVIHFLGKHPLRHAEFRHPFSHDYGYPLRVLCLVPFILFDLDGLRFGFQSSVRRLVCDYIH